MANKKRISFRAISSGAVLRVRLRGEELQSLVLVHGSFSDHQTNWEFVLPALSGTFTVHAVARRGRGAAPATLGHGIEDEAHDVVRAVRSAGPPAILLGHSYGAHVALAAARLAPELIRALVLYEAPWPSLTETTQDTLEGLAAAGDWDGFAYTFFRDTLSVPVTELDDLRASTLWPPIVADAPASLQDLRALARYEFDPQRFAGLTMPVLLQIGSESPRDFYVTGALAAVLPNARIDVLQGQAHEGMTTDPNSFVDSVMNFAAGLRREAGMLVGR